MWLKGCIGKCLDCCSLPLHFSLILASRRLYLDHEDQFFIGVHFALWEHLLTIFGVDFPHAGHFRRLTHGAVSIIFQGLYDQLWVMKKGTTRCIVCLLLRNDFRTLKKFGTEGTEVILP